MKRVLCADLGQVMIRVNVKVFENKVKPKMRGYFWDCMIARHDRGLIDTTDFWMELNKAYFKKPMAWSEFMKYFTDNWFAIHWPIFFEHKDLKEQGIKLVAITDMDKVHFDHISRIFPRLMFLFESSTEEKPELNVVASYQIHSLKRDQNPFIVACSRFGFSPHEAVFVDDNPINIEVAKKLGFKTFLYKINSRRNHGQYKKFLEHHFSSRPA